MAMAAARRRQRRCRRLDKGCGDVLVREAAADDEVDEGGRGGGRGGAMRCGVCVLCFADLTLSYKASKNLETFQETSSRLPGTPLPAVTRLVVVSEREKKSHDDAGCSSIQALLLRTRR